MTIILWSVKLFPHVENGSHWDWGFGNYTLSKFIKTCCSKINTEMVSSKIYETNFKSYYKNTRYLQMWLLIIILLVKVYLKYLNVKKWICPLGCTSNWGIK